MTIKTTITCPLGSDCEKIGEDGTLHRCAWYQRLEGVDAQGKTQDENRCAIAWMPILMVEQVRGLAGVQAATESQRNVNNTGLNLVASALNKASKTKTITGEVS